VSSEERKARESIVAIGRSLYQRGLSYGSAGNLSVRLGDRFLMTPTNVALGALEPKRLSLLDSSGKLITGDPPTKEALLHLAIYETRPNVKAVVHLHSTYAVALSCLSEVSPDDVLPALTPYYVMRVGRLVLVPYYPPGEPALAHAVRERAQISSALLLANHGPVVGGTSLEAAAHAAEELEESAKLFLLLRREKVRPLSQEEVENLRARYPQP